jgi:hypothetical protein
MVLFSCLSLVYFGFFLSCGSAFLLTTVLKTPFTSPYKRDPNILPSGKALGSLGASLWCSPKAILDLGKEVV